MTAEATPTTHDPVKNLIGTIDATIDGIESQIEAEVYPALKALASHPEDPASLYIREHLDKAMKALDAARAACLEAGF